MNIFDIRNRLVADYGAYVRSFINISDDRIKNEIADTLDAGMLWPKLLIQLNPAFEPGETIDELIGQGILHDECARVFRIKNEADTEGKFLRLHRHQSEAIRGGRQRLALCLDNGHGLR